MALTKVDTRMIYEKSFEVSQRNINRPPSLTVPAGGVAVGSNLYADEVIEYSEGGQDYRVYVYKTSGIFITENDVTADILVVAGGGAGGTSNAARYSSGGGAGGAVWKVGHTLLSNSFTVIVGSGGATTSSTGKGNDSIFDNLVAKGGGTGGASDANLSSYSSGGCGGGGSPVLSYPNTGGSSIQSAQSGDSGLYGIGYSGGNGSGDTNYNGAGGGGLGESGKDALESNNADKCRGGDGMSISPILGGGTQPAYDFNTLFSTCNLGVNVSGTIYIGGGGGHNPAPNGGIKARGGYGGGGDSGTHGTVDTGSDGAINTGSGGGGNTVNTSGVVKAAGNGGSGIVVIRVHL